MIEQITPSRILYFEFFSNVFLYELLTKSQDILQEQLNLISQEPLIESTFYQQCLQKIQNNFEEIQQEYTLLFSAPFSRQKLSPYLSHYTENCVSGKCLVAIREKLKERKLLLNREICKENEDHIGIICLFLSHLLHEGETAYAKEISNTFFIPIAEGLINDSKQLYEERFYFNVIKILEGFILVEKMIGNVST